MKRLHLVGGIAVVVIAVVAFAISSTPATAAGKGKVPSVQPHAANPDFLGKSARHLMDRGGQLKDDGTANREPRNTLNPLIATPNMSTDTYLWYGSGTALNGGFMGNCFDEDYIPSGWYPTFRITGAWANLVQWSPVNSNPTFYAVAAGAWPVKLPGTGTYTGTWDAFSTYTAPYTTGLVGGVGLWGGTASGGIPVTANQEICAGLLILQAWANALGLKSGGGGSLYATFIGPPYFGASQVAPDSTWLAGFGIDVMAGLYVSGATVPVELQSLHIE